MVRIPSSARRACIALPTPQISPTGLSASSYTINGSNGHQLNGLIYQPSRNITFNSQSNLTAENFTLVVKTLILDTLTWNFGASPKSVSSAGTTTTTAVRLTK